MLNLSSDAVFPLLKPGTPLWRKMAKKKNGVKRHKKNRRAERWTGEGERAAHPFPSPDYCSVHFARRLLFIFFFSLFSPTAESGPRLLSWDNTQEKSLRHVAMEAKFLNDNKPKTSLKKWFCTVSNFIDLIQSLLICQKLAKLSAVGS